MILIHILIGAAAAAGFLWVLHQSRKKQLSVTWWQWGLTILGFLYGLFVLEDQIFAPKFPKFSIGILPVFIPHPVPM